MCEHGDVTVLYNQGVNTGREGTAKRRDITTKNKKEKTCILIDVAIPADRNVTRRKQKINLNTKSLCIEIQRTWNMKSTIMPVKIGASGIVTKVLKKNLEAIPAKYSIDSLQKTQC